MAIFVGDLAEGHLLTTHALMMPRESSTSDTMKIRRSYRCTGSYRAEYTAYLSVRYDGSPSNKMHVISMAVWNEHPRNAIFASVGFSDGQQFYSRRIPSGDTLLVRDGTHDRLPSHR